MSRRKILEKLRKAVEQMEAPLAEKAAREAVAAGLDPVVAINEGLAAGMKRVSELFDEGEVFVPHLLVAAEAFETGVAILTESMSRETREQASQGRVLIHTVQGDIHDIGKNIVKTMLSASGFEVIDLGRDVPVETVAAKARELKVDIIAGAALMTTTMPAQRELVECLEDQGIRRQFKLLFGGTPVSDEWVRRIGADGYADSASAAIEVARRLMAEKKAKIVLD